MARGGEKESGGPGAPGSPLVKMGYNRRRAADG